MRKEYKLMGKRKIVAIVSILALMISLFCFTPDSNAGVATLNLTKQKKTISVGQSFQLKLDGIKASKVKWSSSKPSVAEVNKKGIVKGIKVGTTNIFGRYKSLKFTIKVTVIGKSDSSDSTSKPSESDQLIYSDDKVELYYVGISKSYNDEYDYVDFRVINKMSKTMYWGFDVIYIDGKKVPAHIVDKAMPDMEATFCTYIDKGKKPKNIKGILFAYIPDTGITKYSKEFTYTVK